VSSNPGQESASAIQRASAELQQITAGLALPAMTQAAGAWLADLQQPGQEPLSVRRAFGEARAGVNADAETANAGGRATIRQASLQSGMAYNPAALSEATDAYSRQLEQIRIRQMRSLQFQEAQAGQNQTNQLLSQLIGTGGSILSGAGGYGQGALQGANLMSGISQQTSRQNSTYGSIAGTVIGGLLGSVVPGLGTTVGAGLGGAAGGAIGGMW
jgi:hypothetical protein